MRLLIALMMLFVCCVAGGCGVPTPNENFQTAYNAAKKTTMRPRCNYGGLLQSRVMPVPSTT
jgi:hypothetical protein